MNRKFLIFVLLIISSIFSVLNLNAQSLQSSSVLSFEIEGKEYKELVLNVVCNQIGNVKISATKSTDKSWIFIIPDSVYEKHYRMGLSVVPTDSVVHQFSFAIEDSKLSISDFSIGHGKTTIKALYLSSNEYRKMPAFNYKNVVMDNLRIINPDNNIKASFELIRGGYDMHGDNREVAYSNFLLLTKKYANTHYCTAQLHSKFNLFKSKKEICEFYNVLSTVQKESYFGQKIKSYLDLVYFPQIQLPTISEEKPRSIITDPTRYTLVTFSASWCGPCHEQIPVLQKIYSDLHKSGLDIVYISMDKPSTIKNWEKLIEENKIPWISFLAAKKYDEVSDLYSIRGIPTTFLVHPGGEFEEMDVRNEQKREALYSIIRMFNSNK